jgi:hypothetical protein
VSIKPGVKRSEPQVRRLTDFEPVKRATEERVQTGWMRASTDIYGFLATPLSPATRALFPIRHFPGFPLRSTPAKDAAGPRYQFKELVVWCGGVVKSGKRCGS